ncbi:unnamed protein product [marine sediment metagenome]|uniref:Penicillinase repressor n=1 Tax=marine sediment metagenome TaxID=412755 RepID=X0SLN8_9ZZZZ
MASLTAGELDVMRILWDRGKLKPAEIQQLYPRPIKNAAVRFQLRVLLEKGHVSRRKVGKAYYYAAVTRRDGALRKMARRMADAFSGGSTAGLIAELIKSEKLTADEIRELKRIAGEKPGNANDTRGENQ